MKVHLKKVAQGVGWIHVLPKDPGPDVGKQYETPRCQDDAGVGQAGRSPLTRELLDPGENVSDLLDYEDDVPREDLEVTQAVANIPKSTDDVDVEMGRRKLDLGF